LPPLNEIIEELFNDSAHEKLAMMLREWGWTVDRPNPAPGE